MNVTGWSVWSKHLRSVCWAVIVASLPALSSSGQDPRPDDRDRDAPTEAPVAGGGQPPNSRIDSFRAFEASDKAFVLLNTSRRVERGSGASGSPWTRSGTYLIRAAKSSVRCDRLSVELRIDDPDATVFAYGPSVMLFQFQPAGRGNEIYEIHPDRLERLSPERAREIFAAADVDDNTRADLASKRLEALEEDFIVRHLPGMCIGEPSGRRFLSTEAGTMITVHPAESSIEVHVPPDGDGPAFESTFHLR